MENKDANKKLYTLEEVSKIVMVTRRTLYKYINDGKLDAVKIGREWRVSEDSLNDFLRAGTEN